MTAFVLDASTILARLYREVEVPPAVELDPAEALVPVLWHIEVLNSFLIGLRRGRFSYSQLEPILAEFMLLGVKVDPEPADPMRIFELGREHRLTSYDAAYLELALRRGVPLATYDRELQAAAHKAGVPLIE